MPKQEIEFTQKIKESHPQWNYKLWDDKSISELTIPSNVKKIYDFFGNIKDYVAQSDVLRLFLVYEFGGIYLDVDFEIYKTFDTLNLEQCDAFFCYHNTDINIKTIPNGIIGSKKQSKIFSYIINNMITNEYHSPEYLGRQIKKYYNLDYNNAKHEGKEGLLDLFNKDNIFYMNYNTFHDNYFYHHALYSWSVEGKQKFKEGDYE